MEEMIYAYQFTGENPDDRSSFWRPRRGLMGTIYVSRKEIGYENVDWMHLAQYSIHWTGTSEYGSLIRFGFRKKGNNFKSCATINILKRSVFLIFRKLINQRVIQSLDVPV
jgi:hypothetical protein